ncbi:MAG: lysostaphin resistance A-like protein [Planctomycetota bacterium]
MLVLLVLSAAFVMATALVGLVSTDSSSEWWTLLPAVAAAIAASWVMMSTVESSSLAALGLRIRVPAALDFVRGIGVGTIVVSLAVVALAAAGWVRWLPDTGSVWMLTRDGLVFACLFGVAAFWEELVFRGYPIQVLAEGLGSRPAVLLTAATFAALHGANPGIGWIGFTNTALAGILLGIMYLRTYSLALVTGTHLGWNWTMSFAADLPVSGLDWDTPAWDASIAGPVILTGGSYGPEGGLLLSAITILGIVWALRARWLTPDPEVVALGPLPERRVRQVTAPAA